MQSFAKGGEMMNILSRREQLDCIYHDWKVLRVIGLISKGHLRMDVMSSFCSCTSMLQQYWLLQLLCCRRDSTFLKHCYCMTIYLTHILLKGGVIPIIVSLSCCSHDQPKPQATFSSLQTWSPYSVDSLFFSLGQCREKNIGRLERRQSNLLWMSHSLPLLQWFSSVWSTSNVNA